MMRSKHDVANDALIDHNVFPHMTGTKDIEDQELHHVLKVSLIFLEKTSNLRNIRNFIRLNLDSYLSMR